MRAGIPFAVAAALLAGCARPAPHPALSQAEAAKALSDYWAKYQEITLRGDAAALAALHTEDVSIAFPGVPTLRGRAALEAYLKDDFAVTKYTAVHVSAEDITVLGDHLFEFGTYHEALQPSGKPAQELRGRFAVLLARTSDGMWEIDRLVGFPDTVEAAPTGQ